MIAPAALILATSPLPVTIAALNADPERFAGRQVVLTGEIDDCHGLECAICPDQATTPAALPRNCLPIAFDRRGLPNVDWSAIYRYATVRLTALFDPACRRQGAICTDNATVLFDARVLDVLRRRPSAEGIHHRLEPLTRLGPAASAPLLALARRTWRSMPAGRVRVFVTASMTASGREAVLCRSDLASDDQPGAWPADLGSALLAPSTEDRFRCFIANRDRQGWTITPN